MPFSEELKVAHLKKSSFPWLLVRDFNATLASSDRLNTIDDRRETRSLQSFIEDFALDLPLNGKRFICSNHQQDPGFACLDVIKFHSQLLGRHHPQIIVL